MKKTFLSLIAVLGVSFLATSQIIYTDIDPDVTTTLNGNSGGGETQVVSIDFNQDGVEEYNFSWTYINFGLVQWDLTMTNADNADNKMTEHTQDPEGVNVYFISEGNSIFSNSQDYEYGNEGRLANNSNNNDMQGIGEVYVGCQFPLNGNTHYGWVRMELDENLNFTVMDYAYEATPNTAIAAGAGIIVCEAPTNVTQGEITSTTAAFSWTASANETGGYNWAVYEQGADTTTATAIAEGMVATGTTEVTVDMLTANTSYDFYVQTRCDGDATSEWTQALNFETLVECAPPTNVMPGEITLTTAAFSWTASANETGGYNWAVYEQGADTTTATAIAEGMVATGTTEVTVDMLIDNTSYDFYVQTRCDENTTSNWSAAFNFTTGSCTVPTNIVANTIAQESIQISWDASPNENNGYNWAVYEEGADITTANAIAEGMVATGITEVTVDMLNGNTAYDFYVQTICGENTISDWSTFSFSTLSIASFSLENLVYYPNPVKDIVSIESIFPVDNIEVFDFKGNLIKSIENEKQASVNLKMNDLQSGVYFMKIHIGKESKVYKLIKM